MFARLTHLVAISSAVLTCASALAQEKEQAEVTAQEKSAASLVQLLVDGKFDQATQSFNAKMLEVLPPDQLKKAWETVVDQAGEFSKQIGSRVESTEEHKTVILTCEFAKAKVDARVVFDQDDKIAGLFFQPTPPSGEEEVWEGTLDAGVVQLRVVFHLFKQKDGSYEATMDSPDQDSMGNPLDQVMVQDGKVRLGHTGAAFEFEGKLSEDGKEISGDFSQAGQTFPLTLKKVVKPKDSDPKKSPQPSNTPDRCP